MKYADVISCKSALEELRRIPLSLEAAVRINQHAKRIDERRESFKQKERELAERFAKKNDRGDVELVDRKLTFETSEDGEAYSSAVAGLLLEDCDLEKITISYNELADVKVSADFICRIEKIINLTR